MRKISKVKHKNIMSHKLRVRKKIKKQRKKHLLRTIVRTSKEMPKPPTEPDEACDNEEIEDLMNMMDEEDIEYVMENSSKYKAEISTLGEDLVQKSESIMNQLHYGHGARGNVMDSLDEDCESPIRSKKKNKVHEEDSDARYKYEKKYHEQMTTDDPSEEKQIKFLLPIKTKDGIIMRSTEVDSQDKSQDESQDKSQYNEEEVMSEGDIPDYLKTNETKEAFLRSVGIDHFTSKKEALEKYKIMIGTVATSVLEEPENKVLSLKVLLLALKDTTLPFREDVHKMLAMSLLEIFNDLLPSYELNFRNTFSVCIKLKKDTRKLIDYEASLLSAYKKYLLLLKKMSGVFRNREKLNSVTESLGMMAVHCIIELVRKNPEFNFSKDMGQYLSSFLNSNVKVVRELACKGIGKIFTEDKKGVISLAIVRSIKKMVKGSKFVHTEVVSVLLYLRLKTVNLETEKAEEIKEKMLMKRKRKLTFSSRREHQKQKRLEEVEKQLMETKAEENKDKTHKNFTEIAKVVFTVVFSVLKLEPTKNVLGSVLRVLSKFAHCLNYEFFQDIVNVIGNILKTTSLDNIHQLYCIQTVFTILSDEGDVLNIDPIYFYTRLYQSLGNIVDAKTNEEVLIMLSSLQTALIKKKYKVSLQRMLAFIKRLCTIAVYMNHGNAIGILDLVWKVMKQSRKCEILLDNDSSFGTGVYQPELAEPEYCCANATSLWELTLLHFHYHPYVRQMSSIIMNPESTQTVPEEFGKLSPAEIAELFDPHQMCFRPAVPLPPQAGSSHHTEKVIFNNDGFAQYMEDVESSVCDPVSFDAASECHVVFEENEENNCFTDFL